MAIEWVYRVDPQASNFTKTNLRKNDIEQKKKIKQDLNLIINAIKASVTVQ